MKIGKSIKKNRIQHFKYEPVLDPYMPIFNREEETKRHPSNKYLKQSLSNVFWSLALMMTDFLHDKDSDNFSHSNGEMREAFVPEYGLERTRDILVVKLKLHTHKHTHRDYVSL